MCVCVCVCVCVYRASFVAQSVKNLPAVQETGVRSLDWEDPLEKEMDVVIKGFGLYKYLHILELSNTCAFDCM